MSYRTLALASALFAMGCGASAPPQPGPAAASAPAPASAAPAGGEKPPETSATRPTAATSAKAPPADAAKPGGSAEPAPSSTAVAERDQISGGTLSQSDIQKILESNAEVFGSCYTLGAGGASKEFRGTVKVKATLGPTGAVKAVQVLSSTTKNPKVDACVGDAFKKIKFPPPKNAATSVITFPIKFGGLEQVQP